MFAAAKNYRYLFAVLVVFLPFVVHADNAQINAQVCHSSLAATTLTLNDGSATTQAMTLASGTADPGSTVEVSDNGQLSGSVVSGDDGSYAVSVALDVDQNTLVATASDGCGHSLSSSPVSIIRSLLPPPSPALTNLSSDIITTDSTIQILGTTLPLVDVTIVDNGTTSTQIQSGADGTFSVMLPLTTGVNIITAFSTNAAGTSPMTSRVTITRNAFPTTVDPQPSTAITPLIRSPSTSTTTTTSSINLSIASAAGRLEISRNGSVISTIIANGFDNAEVSIPLLIGLNNISVALRTASGLGEPSLSVAITREQPPLVVPTITSPPTGISSSRTHIMVTGTAPPGVFVEIMFGDQLLVEVRADDSGHWSAAIPLSAASTMIVARYTEDGVTAQSVPVTILFGKTPVIARTTQIMTSVITTPAALIALSTQQIIDTADLLGTSPVKTGLAVGVLVLAATATSHLVGLSVLWQLPALLSFLSSGAWWRAGRRGRIIDMVTSQPLPMATLLLTGSSRLILSDRQGQFRIPHDIQIGSPVTITRSGYTSMDTTLSAKLQLKPAQSTSAFKRAIGILIQGFAWLFLVFGTITLLVASVIHPSWWIWLATLIFLLLLIANMIESLFRPRRHFGHVLSKRNGHPVANARISLLERASGIVISRYDSDSDGCYTLYAPPGDYRLQISAPGYEAYTEPVHIIRHQTYFGFTIKLRPGSP